jgi:hypothetical protein
MASHSGIPTIEEALLSPTLWATKQNNWRRAGIYNPPSREQYLHMLDKANGVCPLCGRAQGQKGLALHHNQITGDWVGLLCTRCNLGMGQFEDDPELLQRATDYAKHETWGSREEDYEYENTVSLSSPGVDLIEENYSFYSLSSAPTGTWGNLYCVYPQQIPEQGRDSVK